MKESIKDTVLKEYGTEKFGSLKKVLTHNPVKSISRIDNSTLRYYLFNKVPHWQKYLKEHDRYTALLKSLGIDVYELSDYVYENRELMYRLPNLAYQHDISVITSRGAILSKMCPGGRQHEEVVVKEALTNLGIPVFQEFDSTDNFESCLLLSPRTIMIANTERHKKDSINKFISRAHELFDEVLLVSVPKLRRYMHADMIFGRVNEKVALAYLPAFLHTCLITKDGKKEIHFKSFMEDKGVEIIEVSNREQERWGCSFVPLNHNTFIHYDLALSKKTEMALKNHGIDIIKFHPEALLAGGGSLKCLTLRLLRKDS